MLLGRSACCDAPVDERHKTKRVLVSSTKKKDTYAEVRDRLDVRYHCRRCENRLQVGDYYWSGEPANKSVDNGA